MGSCRIWGSGRGIQQGSGGGGWDGNRGDPGRGSGGSSRLWGSLGIGECRGDRGSLAGGSRIWEIQWGLGIREGSGGGGGAGIWGAREGGILEDLGDPRRSDGPSRESLRGRGVPGGVGESWRAWGGLPGGGRGGPGGWGRYPGKILGDPAVTHIPGELGKEPPELPHLLALVGIHRGDVGAGGLGGTGEGVKGDLPNPGREDTPS